METENKKLVAVKRLAKTQCANFQGFNSCVFYTKCKYYQEKPERCKYFENWVLPGDSSIESKYMDLFNLTKPKQNKRKERRK